MEPLNSVKNPETESTTTLNSYEKENKENKERVNKEKEVKEARKNQLTMHCLELHEEKKGTPYTEAEALTHTFNFWSQQPVAKLEEFVAKIEQVNEVDVSKVQKNPMSIFTQKDSKSTPVEMFVWDTKMDIGTEKLNEIYELLHTYYRVEGKYKLHYSKEFIKWAFSMSEKNWLVGVRIKANNKLVGFVGAKATNNLVDTDKMNMAEVFFMCVTKKLRKKGLGVLLMREIRRQIELDGYTNGCFVHRVIYHHQLWE